MAKASDAFRQTAAFIAEQPMRLRRQQADDLNAANANGARAMRRAAPVRTGRLRRAIQVLDKASESSPSAAFGVKGNVPYAAAQNFGFTLRNGRRYRGRHFLAKGIAARDAALRQRGYR